MVVIAFGIICYSSVSSELQRVNVKKVGSGKQAKALQPASPRNALNILKDALFFSGTHSVVFKSNAHLEMISCVLFFFLYLIQI